MIVSTKIAKMFRHAGFVNIDYLVKNKIYVSPSIILNALTRDWRKWVKPLCILDGGGLDPNFGYETKGANAETIQNVVRGSVFPLPQNALTLDSITVYLRSVRSTSAVLHPNGMASIARFDVYPVYDPPHTHDTYIDEYPPNDSTDYLSTTSTSYVEELYHLDNWAIPAGKGVTKVTVYARVRSLLKTGYIRMGIVTHGTLYYHYYSIPLNWTTKSWSWAKNPDTDADWTQAEINDLILSMQLRNGTGGIAILFSTMWVVIEYADATIKVKSVVYNHTTGVLKDNTDERIFDQFLDSWETFTFPAPKSSADVDDYILMAWSDKSVNIYYDAGDLNQGHYYNKNYNAFDIAPAFTHEDRKYSIYCTYTAAVVKKAKPSSIIPLMRVLDLI